MLKRLQNWLMNVAAKWIWIAIMMPIRIVLGLCYAISKHMPDTVELPYELKRKETKQTKELALFFKKLGSIVETVNVDYHDRILAITSHLPHLIAYTIVGTASDLESDLKNDVIKYSASGFRDFTRIASSDPIMWRDIFVNNSEAVLEMLQRFNEDLSDLQKAIRKKDGEKLHSFFSRTKSIRERIIDAGQS